MPTTTTAPETVTLNGGLMVSLTALRLLWRFEDEGFDVKLGDDGRILVGPAVRLSEADKAAIRQHKPELVLLVRYCEVVQ